MLEALDRLEDPLVEALLRPQVPGFPPREGSVRFSLVDSLALLRLNNGQQTHASGQDLPPGKSPLPLPPPPGKAGGGGGLDGDGFLPRQSLKVHVRGEGVNGKL